MKYITIDKVTSYGKIIQKVIRLHRYLFPPYVSDEDLQQEAMLALMNALNDYDQTKGASDITLIYKYVETHIRNYSRSFVRELEDNQTNSTNEEQIPLCLDSAEATAALIDIEEACTTLEWAVLECKVLGMTKQEIADRFDLKRKKLESVLCRLDNILRLASRD